MLQAPLELGNNFVMTQDSEEIPPASWYESLESLTKQRQGDLVTIEVLSLDLGDEYEAERLPFAYIEFDSHDNALNVAVGGRDGRYPVVLRHTVTHPRRIAVTTPTPDEEMTVDVTGGDGVQTLITFHQLPALPA
jgi:Family of unknown function (DUF5335)